MPRPKSPTMTDGELRLMRVLWERGQATVGEVVDAAGHARQRDRTLQRGLRPGSDGRGRGDQADQDNPEWAHGGTSTTP